MSQLPCHGLSVQVESLTLLLMMHTMGTPCMYVRNTLWKKGKRKYSKTRQSGRNMVEVSAGLRGALDLYSL